MASTSKKVKVGTKRQKAQKARPMDRIGDESYRRKRENEDPELKARRRGKGHSRVVVTKTMQAKLKALKNHYGVRLEDIPAYTRLKFSTVKRVLYDNLAQTGMDTIHAISGLFNIPAEKIVNEEYVLTDEDFSLSKIIEKKTMPFDPLNWDEVGLTKEECDFARERERRMREKYELEGELDPIVSRKMDTIIKLEMQVQKHLKAIKDLAPKEDAKEIKSITDNLKSIRDILSEEEKDLNAWLVSMQTGVGAESMGLISEMAKKYQKQKESEGDLKKEEEEFLTERKEKLDKLPEKE